MYYRTRHKTVAEDLTAEVFAQVVTAIERYEDRGLPFGAWLFRIARARLVDYIRRQKVRDTLPLSEDTISSQVAPSPEKTLNDLYFSHLLQYLTEEQQEVVILRFVGGLSNSEIADVIGSNANAVKQKVFRALTRLRAVLGEERGDHVV